MSKIVIEVEVGLDHPVQIGDNVMLCDIIHKDLSTFSHEMMIVTGDIKTMIDAKVKRIIKLRPIQISEILVSMSADIGMRFNEDINNINTILKNIKKENRRPRFRTITSEPMMYPAWRPITCKHCYKIGEAYIPGRLEREDQKIVVECPFCGQENMITQYNHPGGAK